MGKFTDRLLAGTPRYGRCAGCDEPIAEVADERNDWKARGSNRWSAGPNIRRTDPPMVRSGRNDDDSINRDGSRCRGTEDGKGKHTPRDGSIW